MKIIIKREPDFEKRHFYLLEFSGKFEGDEEDRAGVQLGNLQKVNPAITKDKANYILEMGTMDISGFEVKDLNETFLHVETV